MRSIGKCRNSSTRSISTYTAAEYTEKMRKQALEKLAAMQKTMLKMNPDSIMFKPVSIILLVGIIVIYWLFFGMVYQNEYFKNASIFLGNDYYFFIFNIFKINI